MNGIPTYGNTASMPSLSPEPYNMPSSYTPGGNTDPYFQETAPYPTTPAPYIPSTQLPPVLQPASLPYIPDTQLPVNLQPPISLPYIPNYELDPSLQPVEPLTTGPAGPIEWIVDAAGNVVQLAGDVVKTVADTVWDAGKFILDHLEVGVSYAGDIGSQKTQQRYYEDLGEAQKTAAEAARIKAQAYADQVAAGTMTAEEAIARGVGLGIETLAGIPNAPATSTAGPILLTTPTAQAAGPNYLLYAAIAIAAYYFLR